MRGRAGPGPVVLVSDDAGLVAELFEQVVQPSPEAWRGWRDAGLVARSLTVKVSDIVAFVTETSQGAPHSYTPCYT